MKFRILVQHTDEAVKYATNLIKDCDVVVYDVRETEIIDSITKKKRGEGYILCCEASAYNYLQVKEKYYDTELKHEKVRTLM